MKSLMTFEDAMGKLNFMKENNIPLRLADEVMTEAEFIERQPHYANGCGCLIEDYEIVNECGTCFADRLKMERDAECWRANEEAKFYDKLGFMLSKGLPLTDWDRVIRVRGMGWIYPGMSE